MDAAAELSYDIRVGDFIRCLEGAEEVYNEYTTEVMEVTSIFYLWDSAMFVTKQFPGGIEDNLVDLVMTREQNRKNKIDNLL